MGMTRTSFPIIFFLKAIGFIVAIALYNFLFLGFSDGERGKALWSFWTYCIAALKGSLNDRFRRTNPISQQQLWRARGLATLGMGDRLQTLQATTTSLNIHGLYLGELRIAKVDSI